MLQLLGVASRRGLGNSTTPLPQPNVEKYFLLVIQESEIGVENCRVILNQQLLLFRATDSEGLVIRDNYSLDEN